MAPTPQPRKLARIFSQIVVVLCLRFSRPSLIVSLSPGKPANRKTTKMNAQNLTIAPAPAITPDAFCRIGEAIAELTSELDAMWKEERYVTDPEERDCLFMSINETEELIDAERWERAKLIANGVAFEPPARPARYSAFQPAWWC